ncbi:MAG: 3-phosphoserine/phosphohydroxythreonine transaminase [FCB group bacterium]|jgi:phosphoserine aminotransferase|nr:3-phosphoserine/phosphohydroxythreonine transaminase [FCB group bacterium]
MDRVYNFSAGPATLPLPALEEAQRDLVSLPGAGMSVMEMSHRSKPFAEVLAGAKENIKTLMNLPDEYKVLFIQGGASLQFSMLAMNFLRGSGKAADYIITGSWGKKAIKEGQREGETRKAWDGKDEAYNRVPAQSELTLNPEAAYVHFTSNETIEGVEFFTEPETNGVPLICDASSDFLSRPIDITKYGMIYAGAQKNVGPSGMAIVIVREDLVAKRAEGLPSMLDYKLVLENDSLYNTPPCFGIYMVKLVTGWVLNTIGGLEKMEAVNRQKAKMLYDAIDGSNGFYRGHAKTECRSIMNVTWRLPNEDMEADFVKQAKAKGLSDLKGHRSVGGIRASIYNAMPVEGVQALRDFMLDYAKQQG